MTLARPLTVTALALLLGTTGLALTFEAGGNGANAQTEAPAPDVAEDELMAFARATLSMAALRETYLDRIATAASEAEQQALVEEGNAAMMTAIDEEPGIDIERYIEINEAAQRDGELNARIVTSLEQIAEES